MEATLNRQKAAPGSRKEAVSAISEISGSGQTQRKEDGHMPLYRYQGHTETGKLKRGRMSAATPREVSMRLRDKGIIVTHLEEAPESIWTKEITFERKVKDADFVMFLRQFAALLKAGVSVVDATALLAEQTESEPLKKALYGIDKELQAGNPFSAAASAYKKVFPPLSVHIIRAGELSGQLDESFERLAAYYEKQYDTKQKIRSALAYPAVVIAASIIVIIFMLAFVIPRFQAMFAGLGIQMPLITRLVFGASRAIAHGWWGLIFLAAAAAVALYFLKKAPGARYFFDKAVLKLPVFGILLEKAAIARFTRTLGSLLSGSVPILESVQMAEQVVGNAVIREVLAEARDSVAAGESLAEPMKKSGIIPPLVTQMIAVGETTGSLDEMLAKVADFYEADVGHATERVKALLEPLLIAALSVIVGVIILAVIVPMFSLYNQLD